MLLVVAAAFAAVQLGGVLGVSLPPVAHVLRPSEPFSRPLVLALTLGFATGLGAVVPLILAVVLALEDSGAAATVLAIAAVAAVET